VETELSENEIFSLRVFVFLARVRTKKMRKNQFFLLSCTSQRPRVILGDPSDVTTSGEQDVKANGIKIVHDTLPS
jgi:hypothetical protein